jgi:hypothetical protein
MRLSEWRRTASSKEAVGPKVTAVVDPVIASFGTSVDPECWVAWGEEPAQRHTILVITPPGLVTCYVRVNVPGEGPRAAAKLIRWNRVQLGELAIETQGSHRLLSFQVEALVLRGADDVADRIAAFALDLFDAVDGRPPGERGRSSKARAGSAAAATGRAAPAKGSGATGSGATGSGATAKTAVATRSVARGSGS